MSELRAVGIAEVPVESVPIRSLDRPPKSDPGCDQIPDVVLRRSDFPNLAGPANGDLLQDGNDPVVVGEPSDRSRRHR
jgi:hypothetical protein